MHTMLMIWGGLGGLLRLLFAHLAVTNEGSPSSSAAFVIADPELAQAFYGRLSAGTSDYYRFQAMPGTLIRFSMLVPEQGYAAGQRAILHMTGPGLPTDGWLLPSRDAGVRRGSRLYRRTQREEFSAAGGDYLLAVSSKQGGDYCFCIGTREPGRSANQPPHQV